MKAITMLSSLFHPQRRSGRREDRSPYSSFRSSPFAQRRPLNHDADDEGSDDENHHHDENEEFHQQEYDSHAEDHEDDDESSPLLPIFSAEHLGMFDFHSSFFSTVSPSSFHAWP